MDRAVLHLGAQDWARSRFVRSLLWETTHAVRTLTDPRQQQHHQAWLALVDRGAARHRLPVLTALNPRAGWIPDFLAPPPSTGARTFGDELAEVAEYPLDAVARDLARSLGPRPARARADVLDPLVRRPGEALERLLVELTWAWTELLAPYWPRVRELVDADIAYRSRQAARFGLGRVVADLHADVSVQEATITVERADDVELQLAGRGLSLLPSAYIWPRKVVVHDPPWPPTLVYPARGVGELWTAPPDPPTGLAGVLGATRALLLADLARPATTTTLAGRHRLSPAAVSTQLQLLLAAGLVTSRREGKEVFYRRSPLADQLVTTTSRDA